MKRIEVLDSLKPAERRQIQIQKKENLTLFNRINSSKSLDNSDPKKLTGMTNMKTASTFRANLRSISSYSKERPFTALSRSTFHSSFNLKDSTEKTPTLSTTKPNPKRLNLRKPLSSSHTSTNQPLHSPHPYRTLPFPTLPDPLHRVIHTHPLHQFTHPLCPPSPPLSLPTLFTLPPSLCLSTLSTLRVQTLVDIIDQGMGGDEWIEEIRVVTGGRYGKEEIRDRVERWIG